MCDYDRIFEAVEKKKYLFKPSNDIQAKISRIVILADAAHSIGATYKGKMSGEVEDFTAFSFHAVKNLTTGEGGAVVWRDMEGGDKEKLDKEKLDKEKLEKERLGNEELDNKVLNIKEQDMKRLDNEALYKQYMLLSLHGQSKGYDLIHRLVVTITIRLLDMGILLIKRYKTIRAKR